MKRMAWRIFLVAEAELGAMAVLLIMVALGVGAVMGDVPMAFSLRDLIIQ